MKKHNVHGWQTIAIIFALLLVMFKAFSKPAAAGEPPIFPVQWDEKTFMPFFYREKPKSADDFNRLLKVNWKDDDGSDFNVSVMYQDGKALKEKIIINCNDLLAFPIERIKSITNPKDILWSDLTAWKMSCQALKRVGAMKESKSSYISFDVKSLLVALSKIRNKSGERLIAEIGDMTTIRNFKCKRPTSCHFTNQEYALTISLLAIGDYNDDGIQDAMIQTSTCPLPAGGCHDLGIIVTRDSAGGDLRVLEKWEY